MSARLSHDHDVELTYAQAKALKRVVAELATAKGKGSFARLGEALGLGVWIGADPTYPHRNACKACLDERARLLAERAQRRALSGR